MLPQARRVFPLAWSAGLLGVIVLLGSCGGQDSPDARVRAVIAGGEQAAEVRDLSGILEYVSPSFQAEHGGGREELKQYLRAYLVSHASVRLLVRIEDIEFPYRDYARVQLTLGTLGREAVGAEKIDLAADVNDVVLELQLEDDAWKVVRAAWQSRRRG